MTTTSTPNPLRVLGLARVVAGLWFIADGVTTLRQYSTLVPQAARLFGKDVGATDAPLRSLLILVLAPALVLLGAVLVVKGFGWLRSLPAPPAGPAAITSGEVIAALRQHQLPAYADGAAPIYWPLRRWLADPLAAMTSWRRELVSRSVRAFGWSGALVLVVSACWLGVSALTTNELLGPFPTGFVVLLPCLTALWAALGLLSIAPSGGRIESIEFALPSDATEVFLADQIIESPPRLLTPDPAAPGITLGLIGVAIQCLLLAWWNLSYLGFPLLATSIIRDAGSIAGGIVFFVLGHRTVTTAAELLLRCRYDSILVLIDGSGDRILARAAAVRTESREFTGSRHVIAAVAANYVRDSAQKLVQERLDAAARAAGRSWRRS